MWRWAGVVFLVQAGAAQAENAQPCTAKPLAQYDPVTVKAEYGGQAYEFRITVDGKTVPLTPEEKRGDNVACAPTS